MTMVYIPPPEKRPLFIRPIEAAGGITPVALFLVSIIAGPAILGLCVLVVEVSALLGR